jgi:hypothetical protein
MTNLEKIKQRINADPVEFFMDADNRCPLATMPGAHADAEIISKWCPQHEGYCDDCIRDWLSEEDNDDKQR